jgi:ribosome-associated translation inhibitor RaiA
MHIQVNSDHNLQGGEPLVDSVRATVEDALGYFSDRITRVEVHLGDENAGKSGDRDKRCMMEARIEGQPPIAVTEHADTIAQAIDGAAERLVHRLEHTFGRLQDKRRREPVARPEGD